MPIVDYNRIYGVRSRERQPVLYSPHMIPDAAGATMRAGAPGLSARLADADARARERQGSLRAQYAAIGNLIRVGGQVGETVARAVERRDEADFNALAAAWQNHMNAGARDAFQRRYARGGEGGEGADGPSRAIRDLDAAFDTSDAFKNARDGVKKRFGEWRTQHRQPYFDKADDRQADLADAWQKQVLEDRFAAADAGIKQLYEIGDNDKWGMAVGDAVEAKIALARWAYEKDGLTLSEDRQNKIENELLQGYFQDRASFQLARVAAADTPAGASEYENEVVSLINSGVLDDPTRQTVEGLLSRARESRERNVERLDTETQKRLVEAAADLVGKTEAANPNEVFKFADDATAAAMQIRDESKRATALKRIDGAVGIVEFDNWAERLADVMDDFNNIGNGADAKSAQKKLREVADVIGTMRSESGKAMAQQALAGAFKGRREDIVRKVSEVLERGWYFDREAGHWEPLTREQALDLFQNNIVFMDQDARDKARKALDKGRPRMTADSIAALNTFLGANQAQILFDWDKVGASENGDMAYAPKDDWGKRGTIDIWNGRRDVDVDRAMAQKIWTIAERWQDLMRSGVVQKDAKGAPQTLDQYLDQQLKDDAEWRNWRDATIAERVEKTMELLDTQVDSMFFATPNR